MGKSICIAMIVFNFVFISCTNDNEEISNSKINIESQIQDSSTMNKTSNSLSPDSGGETGNNTIKP